jgi:hypothetical protein
VSTTFVYDSGALIAMDVRHTNAALADHSRRLAEGGLVLVPAVAAARAVRDPATQARLMHALRGCKILPFDRRHYAAVGRLLARSRTDDVVDAYVALAAVWAGAGIITSDPGDMRALLEALDSKLPVFAA